MESQRMGCNPVTWTLKQSQNVHCHKLTQRCMPFSVWWATTGSSSRSLHALHNHSVNVLPGKGPAGSQSRCHLQKMPWRLLKHWSRCVWQLPFWLLLDYTKLFLLETDMSKDGLEAVLLQKQADRWYHSITYGSRALTPYEKNYHSTKLKFLALKWAVVEHFKEYLSYQSFLVSTPNLDAMGHWWVSALAQFNFELENQKGCDNTVADVLSWVTTWLDPDTMRSVLNRVTLGTVYWAEVYNPAEVEGNHCLEQEIHFTTGCTLVQMHVTDWAEAQKKDPMLSAVLDWLKAQKKTVLKALLAEHASSEESKLILQNWQNFTIHQRAMYLHSTPKGETEDLLLFMVPRSILWPPWMGATEMWVIRDVTIPCLFYGSVSGGQVWPMRCSSLSSPAHIAYAWGQFVQIAPTPNCGHCSNGPPACRVY